MYNSLKALLEHEPASEVADVYGLSFVAQYTNVFGDLVTHELKPDGANIEVHGGNRFVSCCAFKCKVQCMLVRST